HALGIAEHALARRLRVELPDFGRERLESVDVRGERGDLLVHGRRRFLLEQALEATRAIALPLPPQDRLRHPRPPCLDRLPHGHGDVRQKGTELVAGLGPRALARGYWRRRPGRRRRRTQQLLRRLGV